MANVEDKTVTAQPGPDAVDRPLGAAKPAPGDFAPGSRIRQYEVIRLIGRGGMGRVFLARDLRLARRVALKFLTTTSPKLTDQFLAEARTTAQCTHENIVVIHEADQ